MRSGPEHDGRRWVVAAAHLRASRQEGDAAAPRARARSARGAVEGTFDLRDPLPAVVQASGLVTAPIAPRAAPRGAEARA